MVDVVASFGYTGQPLQFVDQERFAHIHGKGLYLYDTVKGPREILWRSEKDLRAVTTHVDLALLFLSFATPNQGLEVVRVSDTSSPLCFANPCQSAMTRLATSRNADRLFALSDVTDHRLCVWTLDALAISEGRAGTAPPSLVASKALDNVCHSLGVNPCDENHVALWGRDGLFLAQVHEVFGAYTLKVDKLFPSKPLPQALPGAEEVILFCTWLPFNRVLVGLESGDVYEVHCETREELFLGRFYDGTTTAVTSTGAASAGGGPRSAANANSAANSSSGSGSGGVVFASCVTLTAQHVIVGAHDGGVFWYAVGSLFSESHNHALASPRPHRRNSLGSNAGNANNAHSTDNAHNAHNNALNAEQALLQKQLFATPLRVLRLTQQPIASLAVDPTFTVLIVGTYTGALFRAQIESDALNALNADELNSVNANGGNANGGGGPNGTLLMSMDEETDKSRKVVKSVESVEVELLGNDAVAGVVVSAKFLSLSVRKISSRARATLSLLMLATQDGALSLWRHGGSAPETISSSQGVRRSAPRALKQLLSLSPHTPNTAIVAMESLFYGAHTVILSLALDNGMLEFWAIHSTEQEEDDTRDSAANSSSTANLAANFTKMTEDDEGSIMVKFEISFLMKTQCYKSAFSSLTLCVESSSEVKLAVSAAEEPMIYVLSIIRNARLDPGKVVASYEVSCGNVVSTVAMDEFLYAVTDGNSVMRYFPRQVAENNSSSGANTRAVSPTHARIAHSPGATLVVGNQAVSVAPERLKFSIFGSVARLYASPIQNSGLAITSQGVAHYFTHCDDINFRVSWEKVKHRKLIEHKDLVACAAFSPNGNLLAIGGIDGTLTLWKIEGETCNDILLVNTLELHQAAVVSVVFSSDSSTLLSGAVDGSAHVLFVGGKSPNKTRQASMLAHNKSGITAAAALAIAGDDDAHVAAEFRGESNLLLLEDKLRQEAEKDLRAQYKFKCMGVSAAVQEIVSRLQTLIAQNDARSALEQLPHDEFVIDLARKREIEDANRENVVALRESYARRDKFLHLLAARLRKRTWDTASAVSTALRPLLNPPEIDVSPSAASGVTSFSIPRSSQRESVYLEKIKRLRRLEVRSMRVACERGERESESDSDSREIASVKRVPGTRFYRCCWASSVRGCAIDCAYIVNDALLWPLSDRADAAMGVGSSAAVAGVASGAPGAAESATNKDKDGAVGKPAAGKDKDAAATATAATAATALPLSEDDLSVGSADEEIDVDEHEFLNLLYAPEATRSLIQKKNQLLFLQEVARRVKEKFNASFTALRHEKDDLMQFVNSRSDRVAEILAELKIEETVWRPAWLNDETHKNQITVSPEELVTQPYEPESVKLQRQREAEERARKARGDENELVKQRALEDMMHGTLEVKRDVLADALFTLKPAWMDELSPAEMNEQQLKEFDAFKEKLRVFQEEQAHYRKTLEQEMKKLKQEVVEQCKAFNDKLEALGKQKILVQKQVLAQEMYITNIANSVVKAESLRSATKHSEDSLQQIRKDRTELKGRIEKFAKKFDEMKAKLLALQEEEKNLEKTFKRDLQNLCNNTFDQDSLKVFTQLYRLRTYPRSAAGVAGDETGGAHDSSEIDASTSAASNRNKRSKNVSGSGTAAGGANKHGRSQSKAGGAGGGKKGPSASRMKQSRNVSAGGGGTSGQGGGLGLGPMQQAAAALRSSEADVPSYKDKDPFYAPILAVNRQKKAHEVPLPVMNQLSMELDCPEGFVVDQFSWSKLQELRNGRIEKEIESKSLTNELQEIKQKMQVLDDDEVAFSRQVNDTRQQRDQATEKLKQAETNLHVLANMLQGQDEVDRDSVVTDYSSGLLLPVEVINKFNARIKELGGDKIGVLSKIKLFRRKINLIAWEALHQGLQARHFENYFTDLQLFRVTRDLQKVILEGENAFNQKERVEKINTRKDYLAQEYNQRNSGISEKLQSFQKALKEREAESSSLREKIAELEEQVNMSMSIKRSKESAMGPGNTMEKVHLDKMKKVVNRRKLVDLARAQAEEIDFLRQELDRMRQRTFPSFVKATKTRIGPS